MTGAMIMECFCALSQSSKENIHIWDANFMASETMIIKSKNILLPSKFDKFLHDIIYTICS